MQATAAPARPRGLSDLQREALHLARVPVDVRRRAARKLVARRRADLRLYVDLVREVRGRRLDVEKLEARDSILLELETLATA